MGLRSSYPDLLESGLCSRWKRLRNCCCELRAEVVVVELEVFWMDFFPPWNNVGPQK
jgi:hypothetical protein